MASSSAAATGPSEEFRYPGNRLGLPEDGAGSVATWGRRLLALLIDWLIAGLIASVVMGRPMWAGGSIGHRICDLRVLPVRDGKTFTAPPGLLAGILRALLVSLLIPAVIFDRDRRGLHDLAARTIVVRR